MRQINQSYFTDLNAQNMQNHANEHHNGIFCHALNEILTIGIPKINKQGLDSLLSGNCFLREIVFTNGEIGYLSEIYEPNEIYNLDKKFYGVFSHDRVFKNEETNELIQVELFLFNFMLDL